MRVSTLLPALVLLVPVAFAQAPAPAPGTTVPVELQHKLDSKKAKVGDRVVAKVRKDVKVGDTVVIHKNDLFVGTVTTDTVSEHHSVGKVGVLFNEATDKKGTVLAHFRATIVGIPTPSSNVYGMLTRSPDLGGNYTPPPMAGGASGGDRADNGTPIAFAIMESFNGIGTDLGGVMTARADNFSLDGGTEVTVRVLH